MSKPVEQIFGEYLSNRNNNFTEEDFSNCTLALLIGNKVVVDGNSAFLDIHAKTYRFRNFQLEVNEDNCVYRNDDALICKVADSGKFMDGIMGSLIKCMREFFREKGIKPGGYIYRTKSKDTLIEENIQGGWGYRRKAIPSYEWRFKWSLEKSEDRREYIIN